MPPPDLAAAVKGRNIAGELSRCKQLASQRLQEPERSAMVNFIQGLTKAFDADACSFEGWNTLSPIHQKFEEVILGDSGIGEDDGELPSSAADTAHANASLTHMKMIKNQMKAFAKKGPAETEKAFFDLVKTMNALMRMNRV